MSSVTRRVKTTSIARGGPDFIESESVRLEQYIIQHSIKYERRSRPWHAMNMGMQMSIKHSGPKLSPVNVSNDDCP